MGRVIESRQGIGWTFKKLNLNFLTVLSVEFLFCTHVAAMYVCVQGRQQGKGRGHFAVERVDSFLFEKTKF
jgi:hypothetical protein